MVVAVLAVVLSFIMGYSMLATREYASRIDTHRSNYLEAVRAQLETLYQQRAGDIDADLSAAAWNDASLWMREANIQPRWDLQVLVSERQVDPRTGVRFRRLVAFLPSTEHEANPPGWDPTTGQFIGCTNPDPEVPCEEPTVILLSGEDIQRVNYERAHDQVEAVAARATSFFKARMLLIPGAPVDINHFRAPFAPVLAPCMWTTEALYLPCLDTYTDLNSPDDEAGIRVRQLLGFSADNLVNPWGLSIQASNLEDSNAAPFSPLTFEPFSMSFRSPLPWGDFIQIHAIQPL